MNNVLTRLSRYIDRWNTSIGKAVSWLNTVLVVLICWDVFMRYFLDDTSAWILELEWHLFALIFLLGGAYTMKADKHVRVDVFYANLHPRKKAWINLAGSLVLLVPWCVLIIYTSFHYAENAFVIREVSPDPGGLPARYLIKFSITLGFALLLLQAVSGIFQSIRTLRYSSTEP